MEPRASLAAQGLKILLHCRSHRRHGFDPWVGKGPWKRKWQPTPVFLPGKIPWRKEPGRLQSTRWLRLRFDWSDLARTLEGRISLLSPIAVETEAPAVKSPSKVTQGKQGRQDSLPGIGIQQKLEDREPLGLRKNVAISFKYNGKWPDHTERSWPVRWLLSTYCTQAGCRQPRVATCRPLGRPSLPALPLGPPPSGFLPIRPSQILGEN